MSLKLLLLLFSPLGWLSPHHLLQTLSLREGKRSAFQRDRPVQLTQAPLVPAFAMIQARPATVLRTATHGTEELWYKFT
ncbi:hypothetical protein LX36DRAFT_653931 [Colletotrichum falcatum]|nr:hypothetical protein LX36DRAFT_653931 [Colletotrichum falcatum]